MRVVICALLVAAAARPVQAQVDLSGEWSARYHEGSGAPDSGARARRLHGPADQRRGPPEGGQLGRVDSLAARAPGEAAPVHVLVARAREYPHHAAIRSGHAGNDRLRAVRHFRPGDARALAGRPAASAGVRAAHLGRLLDGALGRRRAHRGDDAFQGRLAAAQRRRPQRHGDDDRALHAARRRADGRDRRATTRCTSRSRSSAAPTGC